MQYKYSSCRRDNDEDIATSVQRVFHRPAHHPEAIPLEKQKVSKALFKHAESNARLNMHNKGQQLLWHGWKCQAF